LASFDYAGKGRELKTFLFGFSFKKRLKLDMKRIFNKQAFRKIAVEEKLQAGIVLSGSEVKAIRTRGVELKDSLVQLQNGEAFLINALIHPYPFASKHDQQVDRARKLLLSEKEIKRLIDARKKKLTIVPIACYTKGRWVKIELGIGKIKNKRQRKQDLIDKDIKKTLSKKRDFY